MMKIPIAIQNDASISHAITRLLQENISRLVVKGDVNNGIITEKDIGLFLFNQESEKSLDGIQVSRLTNRLTSIHEDMTPHDAAKIMVDKGIGSVGVYSHNEGLIGIITKTDLVKHYLENFVRRKRVGDLMTIEFASTSSGDSLNRAVSEMKNKKISRIFLKNQNDDLEGIMTFRDLFRVALNMGNSDSVIDIFNSVTSAISSKEGLLSESSFEKTTLVKEVMSKNILSVDYNDDVTMACSVMLENNLNGVGVKMNSRISGVISKTDIIKAIVALN